MADETRTGDGGNVTPPTKTAEASLPGAGESHASTTHRPSEASGNAGSDEPTVADEARELKDEARQAAREAKDEVADEARRAKAEAKAGARRLRRKAEGAADELTDSLGERIGHVARALRVASDSLSSEGERGMAHVADDAADQVDRVGGYLEDEDTGAMMADVQDLGRRNPAAFLGGAFALGLAAGRFLRASRPDPRDEGTVRRPSAEPAMAGVGEDHGRTP